MPEATTFTISPEFRQRARAFRRALIPWLLATEVLLCGGAAVMFYVDTRLNVQARNSRPPIENLVTETRIAAEQKGLSATYETSGDIYPFIRQDVEKIQRGTFSLRVSQYDPETKTGAPSGGISWLAKKDKESLYFVSAAHIFTSKDGKNRPLMLDTIELSRPNVTSDRFGPGRAVYEFVPNTDIAVARVWLSPESLSKIKDSDILGFNPRPEIDPTFDRLLTVGFPSRLRSPSQPSGFITSVQTLIPLGQPNGGEITLEGVTLNGASGSPIIQLGSNRRLSVVAVAVEIGHKIKYENIFDRTRQDTVIGRTLENLSSTIEKISSQARPR